ncbi:glycosyltransferase [Tersicoccus sp. Bi-70]|uniref:glycosyltransferase n=1 Tax=Tersicoccus sp. Bi-70 TaxID=1897634 RepID=UPI000976A831|nr:glycosyltransferase [Tersicoccus sp. Bi-70]OMH31237.1 glycosyl transferase family 1 [Tersicoccus sp. Bi-70]
MTSAPSAGPLKILIAADTYPPHMNGAARFCQRLAHGMLARGHEVHVAAARDSSGASYRTVEDGVVVHRLRSHQPPTHPYFRICLPWEINREVRRILEEVRPDVVHVQCHYMIGKAFADTAAKMGIRLIATNHFMPENLAPFLPFPQWFLDVVAKNSWRDMGKVMGQAAVVTTPTPLAAAAMHQHAFLRQVLPVSNGIDAAKYEQLAGEELEAPEYPTVLFVGRLAQEKHVDVLIDAVAKLPVELNTHLEIVGDGEVRPALEARIAELGVGERVRFLGRASDEELRRAYLRATVFCQPGTAELQSLVTLEAMSASKPVVLADAMALPHLVDDGRNGWLFRPNDSTDLADKLRRVIELPEQERLALGKTSREMVNKHDLGATLDIFEALYRGVDYADLTV